MTKPPAAAATRWAGMLPQISWCNEHIDVLKKYRKDSAKDCAKLDDGTTFTDHLLEEYDWNLIADLNAVLRPVAPFISTLEATDKVTSSLVIPMVMALLHATSEGTPVLRYTYTYGDLSSEEIVNAEDLCPEVNAVRKILHSENKRRFVTEEKVGHWEDNLICTILDPRFKLMNFNGATSEMKANAELYLRENFKADWAPNRKTTEGDEDVAPVEKVVPSIFKKPKKKVRQHVFTSFLFAIPKFPITHT